MPRPQPPYPVGSITIKIPIPLLEELDAYATRAGVTRMRGGTPAANRSLAIVRSLAWVMANLPAEIITSDTLAPDGQIVDAASSARELGRRQGRIIATVSALVSAVGTANGESAKARRLLERLRSDVIGGGNDQ